MRDRLDKGEVPYVVPGVLLLALLACGIVMLGYRHSYHMESADLRSSRAHAQELEITVAQHEQTIGHLEQQVAARPTADPALLGGVRDLQTRADALERALRQALGELRSAERVRAVAPAVEKQPRRRARRAWFRSRRDNASGGAATTAATPRKIVK